MVAGEKNSSDPSPRLKSFLKSLTPKDAERIQNICPYVVYFKGNPRLFHYDGEPYDIEEKRFLVELGLLDSEAMRIHIEPRVTVYFQRGIISFHVTSKDAKCLMGIYSFTELGKELLSTIGGLPVDLKFLRKYSLYMNRKYSFLEFTCGYGERYGDVILIPKAKQIFKVPMDRC